MRHPILDVRASRVAVISDDEVNLSWHGVEQKIHDPESQPPPTKGAACSAFIASQKKHTEEGTAYAIR